ncbi:Hypothetical predicted protein, partial [Mytilus galloprovincialis]
AQLVNSKRIHIKYQNNTENDVVVQHVAEGPKQTTKTLNLYLFQNGPRELSCKSYTLKIGSVVGVMDGVV